MANLMQASRQWAARPSDERFISLVDLDEHCRKARAASAQRAISSRGLQAVPVGDDNHALQVIGPNGGAVDVTHWSFGQLAQRASAPAGYLRTLPAPMAADCINYGLMSRPIEDVGVLLYKNGGPAQGARNGSTNCTAWPCLKMPRAKLRGNNEARHHPT